ncbi:serine/threonine-protein kinase [Aspergillus clavatus NRRL 1]|uniref:non-specific serine/threonine protein kinase n=1 Tax=Aspergillus clavatus (strain ATCC 1007 / CBS 513.65 / DSM 816 / NCTC 3887 / NRRL 1 / QM 1276 / 107) TaxID=344612 RepID=A1CF49_ASPCL|nr:serine/threonine protein kinase, putative [Aspergillus clavatus NRRL 1]EAW11498.1 serine/threonine protein kinase, putative [Aspergillus clavatus NRRL 1]
MSSNESIGTLEDLHRFPLESLHSFSFAQQSDELLNSRHNILKRSIDFMRDRFGWAASNPAIANAQARMGGDAETQSMVDFMSRTSILGKEDRHNYAGLSRGPLTSPPDVDSGNIFDHAFNGPGSSGMESRESRQGQDVSGGGFLTTGNIPQQRREMKSAPSSRRVSLKRTYTDVSFVCPWNKLMETLAQTYSALDSLPSTSSSTYGLGFPVPALHTHSSKWNPVSQAVFRTESQAPWTILAANDLSCLVFGVTQAELRRLSILEVVQRDHQQWLESKLRDPTTDAAAKLPSLPEKSQIRAVTPRSGVMGKGVTAQLLSKPPSRMIKSGRAQTDDGFGSSQRKSRHLNHPATKSRGVLLCGDVIPIQKRNGTKGSASIWVMEKRGGLIWVLEEIQENVAYISCDDSWTVTEARGETDKIWGHDAAKPGVHITELLPHLPKTCLKKSVSQGIAELAETKYYAARASAEICIPAIVGKEGDRCLRVSSFPHVAGMMVLSSSTLKVISSNPVFSSALFGHERPEGMHVNKLIPGFDNLLDVLTEEERLPLVDGVVIPEPSFRRARTLSILRDGKANVASVFLEPMGITAAHRDGSTIAVDVQLRVVESETFFRTSQYGDAGKGEDHSNHEDDEIAVKELVYALWVTYSRKIHSIGPSASFSPPRQRSETARPSATHSFGADRISVEPQIPSSTLSQQLSEAASEPLTDRPVQPVPELPQANSKETPKKRTITDYVILEEMGQGAYGEVKLARLKKNPAKKVVLKYVTKKRILVDTWTRDRRLGTVPLEIHVLDYLRRDGLKHPNIVEMEGFFEDDINYYIEMKPHGLPGMDLFDYIELKVNMDEAECRNIFRQVVDAIHHLHTKALVVHRDIKDENVILDGEGRIKIIDFGSAAYIKNGPFDVFVGTIDYAAPEVLQGKSYRGKEQDIWALGILLYTIVYKENPFYNIDEILDHPLRIPFVPFSEECIDLIRKMLDRDVDNRLTITEVMEHPWMLDD